MILNQPLVNTSYFLHQFFLILTSSDCMMPSIQGVFEMRHVVSVLRRDFWLVLDMRQFDIRSNIAGTNHDGYRGLPV
jgi:hypothetical protein